MWLIHKYSTSKEKKQRRLNRLWLSAKLLVRWWLARGLLLILRLRWQRQKRKRVDIYARFAPVNARQGMREGAEENLGN